MKKTCSQTLKNDLSKRRRPKIIRKRQIITLITINVSFCVLSMPMVILQIVYYLYVTGRLTDTTEYTTLVYMIQQQQQHQSSNTYLNYQINILNTNATELLSQQEKNKHMDELVDLMHAVAELLQYLNHGGNFILYSLSGYTFRKETKSIFISFFKWMKIKLF